MEYYTKHRKFPDSMRKVTLPRSYWPDVIVLVWVCLLGVPAACTALYLAWVGAWLTLGLILSIVFVGEGPQLRRYSGTSDKGPSEIGTTSLQGTNSLSPVYILSIHFNLRDRDNLSTRDKLATPKVSLIRRFHCILVWFVLYPVPVYPCK